MSRVWGIRHARWLVLSLRFAWWWENFGSRYFVAPNESDIRFLDAVWDGRA